MNAEALFPLRGREKSRWKPAISFEDHNLTAIQPNNHPHCPKKKMSRGLEIFRKHSKPEKRKPLILD